MGSYLSKFIWDGVEYRTFMPNIVVPAESLGPAWLTNTLLTTLVVDVIIVALALLARRGLRQDGSMQGSHVAHAWETLIDVLIRDHVQPILGKRAKAVVPIAVTAFVFIFISAAFVLIPGFESVGKLKLLQDGKDGLAGWCVARVGSFTFVTGVPVDDKQGYFESCRRPAPAANGTPAAQTGYSITPFLRRPTSDINVTLALAIIAFFFVEIQGLRANGWHYFKRFFPVQVMEPERVDEMTGVTGILQGIAGLVELIVELLRIVSFSFRLFGTMFAGSLLVLVMGAILPVLLPTVFLGLEFAAGVVQAFVFLMLITVFTSLAVAHEEQ